MGASTRKRPRPQGKPLGFLAPCSGQKAPTIDATLNPGPTIVLRPDRVSSFTRKCTKNLFAFCVLLAVLTTVPRNDISASQAVNNVVNQSAMLVPPLLPELCSCAVRMGDTNYNISDVQDLGAHVPPPTAHFGDKGFDGEGPCSCSKTSKCMTKKCPCFAKTEPCTVMCHLGYTKCTRFDKNQPKVCTLVFLHF